MTLNEVESYLVTITEDPATWPPNNQVILHRRKGETQFQVNLCWSNTMMCACLAEIVNHKVEWVEV